MSGPLHGIKVLDLTSYLAGPLATQIMGDMGADVIKLEMVPHGDPTRSIGPSRSKGMGGQFLGYNRNKRSIAMDLKRPAARAALFRLVEGADVLVHSVRRQSAERLGIDYPQIAERNRRIVYAWAPGFRQDGPLRDRPAFNDLIEGMAGISGLFQRRDGVPAYSPFNFADKLTGYCLASAIAMALVHRERSGEGQEVQVPMLESMMAFNCIDQLFGINFEPPLPPGFGHPRTLSPQRRPFVTADGNICVQVTTDDQYRRLFEAIGRPDLIEDRRFATSGERVLNATEMLPLIQAEFVKRHTAEWQELLDSADIPNAPMLQLQDMLTSPYIVETGFFQIYQHHSEGELRTPDIAQRYSRTPGKLRCGPPRLGEHTREVLEECGLSSGEIEEIVNAPAAAS